MFVVDFLHPVQAVIPGAHGRVLAVLVETTAELNLRTLARLAGVSVAQLSRVIPGLVELGLVERREVPPSSQFSLNRSNVAAQAIIELARSREAALRRMGEAAQALPVPPISIIIFGSFARGEAGRDSDVDAVVIGPGDIAEDDDDWETSVERWRNEARAITGNPVEVLEVGFAEARSCLADGATLWRDIKRDGISVHGLTVHQLLEPVHA